MCDILNILSNTCFLFILVFISDSCEQRDGNKKSLSEGSPCHQLGLPGICMNFKNCSIAMDIFKRKGYHDLARCGFKGNDEIVCCPELSHRNSTIQTSTMDGFIIPSDGDSSKPPGANVSNVGNQGRLKTKRKCEKMCEKIYTDNKIKPELNYVILNGENASLGQFPHAVALGFENDDNEIEWRCGASLISPRFLLTAAHCFVCYECNDPKRARLGIIDINDSIAAQDVDVKNSISHPEYNPISKHNDIGLVELTQNVRMTKIIYPACLYTEADDPKWLQSLGWGQTVSNDASSRSRILQYAAIESVPVPDCNVTVVSKNLYSSKVILETQICGTTKSDACQGDSGGPMQVQKKEGGYLIVGIVSYVVQCGTKVPGIYTRVARYLDWIEQIVWPD